MPEERYRHPQLDFSISLPDGWRVANEVSPMLVAPGAERRAFAPNVLVTADVLGDGETPEAWIERSLGEQLAALAGARLIDRWPAPGTNGAMRTLVDHAADGRAIALEQWWVAAGGRGWVVTASCAALDYDVLSDDIAAIGASFAPPA